MLLKNSSTSVGFEPANLRSRGEHVTPKPPRPAELSNNVDILSIFILHCNILYFEIHFTVQLSLSWDESTKFLALLIYLRSVLILSSHLRLRLLIGLLLISLVKTYVMKIERKTKFSSDKIKYIYWGFQFIWNFENEDKLKNKTISRKIKCNYRNFQFMGFRNKINKIEKQLFEQKITYLQIFKFGKINTMKINW